LAERVGAWVPSYLRAMAWRGALGFFMRFRRPSVVRDGFALRRLVIETVVA
jgi:hypothetical protein